MGNMNTWQIEISDRNVFESKSLCQTFFCLLFASTVRLVRAIDCLSRRDLELTARSQNAAKKLVSFYYLCSTDIRWIVDCMRWLMNVVLLEQNGIVINCFPSVLRAIKSFTLFRQQYFFNWIVNKTLAQISLHTDTRSYEGIQLRKALYSLETTTLSDSQ